MTDAPIQTRCFRSFAAVRADAGGRLDAAAQPSPFDRLDWFERLHESAFPEQSPLILASQQDEARAWLFLTGAGQQGTLTGIANWYSFAFRPQFHGLATRAERITLLSALARDLRGLGHQLSFHPIVDDGEIDTTLFVQAFESAGWHVIPRILAHKRLLHLQPGTGFETYWAARPGPLRATLRRKARRYPADIVIHHTINDALWSALEAIFAASWKSGGDDFPFLRAFADAEARAGRLRIGLASLAGQPAAVELWTVEQGRAYIHKLAFDERFASSSPGTQLSHAMFRHAIDTDRVTSIDFGTGDNDYKAAWMPQAVPMRQIDAFDLRQPASWRRAFSTWLSALSQPSATGQSGGKTAGGRRTALAAAAHLDD
jgi:hypothetical protein